MLEVVVRLLANIYEFLGPVIGSALALFVVVGIAIWMAVSFLSAVNSR